MLINVITQLTLMGFLLNSLECKAILLVLSLLATTSNEKLPVVPLSSPWTGCFISAGKSVLLSMDWVVLMVMEAGQFHIATNSLYINENCPGILAVILAKGVRSGIYHLL